METLRVLVVDDEEGMRLAVSRALRGHLVRLPETGVEVGFEVAQAASGEAALDEIGQNPPDIILLDHKLPRMSGLDVLKTLAERENDFLTIMITAYASIETAVTATRRGAYDFLAKPFTPEELKSALYKAARQISLQRHARLLTREKRKFRFEMISVVSHELKSPLAAVESYLNVLRDPAMLDDREQSVAIVERCISRIQGMRKLMVDLLDLTRLEAGVGKREMVELDLAAEARKAVDLHREAAKKRSISVMLAAPPILMLRADRQDVAMVINNLVSNAIKYNRDGGEVEIRLSAIENGASIAVRDTGIGMNKDDAARLFTEFTRIRGRETENIEGSGLGLSIVKKVALLYNGEVSLTSKPGEGSEFTVTLQTATRQEA